MGENMQYSTTMPDYTDNFGMITTIDKDGGDSSFYMGHYHYLNQSPHGDVIETSVSLVSPTGIIRRHPDESKWYGDFDRASRDQSIPLLIMLFDCGFMVTAKKIFMAHLKRGLLFTTNTRRNGTTIENDKEEYSPGRFRNYNRKLPDITGPIFWSIYIRGFNFKLLYPLLMVFDLFLLINTITFNLSPREPNQHLLLLHYSAQNMPTLVSYIATKLLNKKKVRRELMVYWWDGKDRGRMWRPYFIGDMWLERLEVM